MDRGSLERGKEGGIEGRKRMGRGSLERGGGRVSGKREGKRGGRGWIGVSGKVSGMSC